MLAETTLETAWSAGNNQQWWLNSMGDDRYQVVNGGTGTALDGAGSTASGATCVMRAPNGSTNSQWNITAA